MLTITEILRRQAGCDTAAVFAPDGMRLAWCELAAFTEQLIERLNERGIGHGNRVALVLPNGATNAIALLAFSCATTVAPLNPAYVEPELEFAFRDLRIDVVVVPAGAAPAARSAAHALGLPIGELRPRANGHAGTFDFDTPWLRNPHRSGGAEPDDIAFILHTSGTTAKPKVVPLVHRRICLTAANIARVLELSTADISLNVMPLFHVHGILNVLLASCIAGAAVVCTEGFDATNFFGYLEAFGVTWYSAVPTIHYGVLVRARRSRPPQLPRLRLIRSSSAPLPVKLAAELEDLFGVPVIESYGMTEVDQIASNPLPPGRRKFGSVGVSGGVDIRLLDENGSDVSQGQTGQVAVRGPNVMSGYENNPEANEVAFKDGFFLTGDLGWRDESGYLFLAGRIKEVINRGGEKITSREIDDCLIEFPGVASAASYGVPHPVLGEEVAAAVVAANGIHLDLAALRNHLAARLAPFKLPKTIQVLDCLPVGPTGKIVRRTLVEASAESVRRESPVSLGDPQPDNFERQLVAAWEDILDARPIGIHDDFYSLGGSSLLAERLFTRLERVFGQSLPLAIAYKARTVRELADDLRGVGWPTMIANAQFDRRVDDLAMRKAEHWVAASNAIAVIGMAGVYPGADDLDEFRHVIEERLVLVQSLPIARAGQEIVQPHWRGAFVDQNPVDPMEAKNTELAHEEIPASSTGATQLLGVAWLACEDAGYDPHAIGPRRVGVWVAQDLSRTALESARVGSASLAALLSERFDWRGPSLDVDTKCSSALVALQAAVHALQCQACDIAIVAAVSTGLDARTFAALDTNGDLSPTGRACALEDDADGWVPGEGVGALVLRRLADAVEDRDGVVAVVGAVETSHGGRMDGVLAVNLDTRIDLVRRALARSRLTPAEIGHVELHAVGTRLGDALEVTVFDRAFADAGGPWSIGTLAASIGHLEAASGMAALHKAILMLASRRILPMPHRLKPNAVFESTNGRFQAVDEPRDWPERGGRDGVCISAVGTSGVAGIAVLGPAPARSTGPEELSPQLFCLSADTPTRLRTYARRIAEQCESSHTLRLVDVCGTINAGRRALPERLAIVARTCTELAASLRTYAAGHAQVAVIVTGRAGVAPACRVVLETNSDYVADIQSAREALPRLDDISTSSALNRCAAFATLLAAAGIQAGPDEAVPASASGISVSVGEVVTVVESGTHARSMGAPGRESLAMVVGLLWCRGVPIDRALTQRLAGYDKVSLTGFPFTSAQETPRAGHGVEGTTLGTSETKNDQGLLVASLTTLIRTLLPTIRHLAPGDNLLGAGLSSMAVALVTQEIERRLEVVLSPVALFEHPTLDRFTAHLIAAYPSECRVWLARQEPTTPVHTPAVF